MRIALRTSGGRGEYEVAGRHDNTRVHDVLDKEIVLEIMPRMRLPTNNFVRHMQGKPRIRLLSTTSDYHSYLILSALLLLPKPKREIGATPGGKLQIYKENFSILSVPFDVVELTSDELVIAPTQMILSNSSLDTGRLDVIERIRIVMACWEVASKENTPIANALKAHKNAFDAHDIAGIMKSASIIRSTYVEQGDPLRHVTKALNLHHLDELMWLGIHATETEEAMGLGEESLEDMKDAARNRVKTWRLLALRGAAGTKFSSEVKQAYNHTCLFTGMRLPKNEITGNSGVDAAHILPWAEYDLNSISNGLCLSKHCHWAFDSGILRLEFNESKNSYFVQISKAAEEAESTNLIDLGQLRSIQGDVSRLLLPKDSSNWPSPYFLKVYNDASNF